MLAQVYDENIFSIDQAVRRGGDTSITPSPRTNRKGMVRLVVCNKHK